MLLLEKDKKKFFLYFISIINNDDSVISFTVRLKLNEESFKQNEY